MPGVPFPALGPIAVALGLGLADWAKDRRRVGVAVLAVCLLAINGRALAIATRTFRQNVEDLRQTHGRAE